LLRRKQFFVQVERIGIRVPDEAAVVGCPPVVVGAGVEALLLVRIQQAAEQLRVGIDLVGQVDVTGIILLFVEQGRIPVLGIAPAEVARTHTTWSAIVSLLTSHRATEEAAQRAAAAIGIRVDVTGSLVEALVMKYRRSRITSSRVRIAEGRRRQVAVVAEHWMLVVCLE